MDYTVEEIIQFTLNILNQIKVPMEHYQDICEPLQKSIVNLTIAKQKLEIERVKAEVEEDEREADSE